MVLIASHAKEKSKDPKWGAFPVYVVGDRSEEPPEDELPVAEADLSRRPKPKDPSPEDKVNVDDSFFL